MSDDVGKSVESEEPLDQQAYLHYVNGRPGQPSLMFDMWVERERLFNGKFDPDGKHKDSLARLIAKRWWDDGFEAAIDLQARRRAHA